MHSIYIFVLSFFHLKDRIVLHMLFIKHNTYLLVNCDVLNSKKENYVEGTYASRRKRRAKTTTTTKNGRDVRIVVTINYRLGIFGFLPITDSINGNGGTNLNGSKIVSHFLVKIPIW